MDSPPPQPISCVRSRSRHRLPLEQQRTLYDLFTRSAGELLDHWFETDLLKALYGFDAIVGNHASPYTLAAPTCCFITPSAKSTAGAAAGLMRSAAWA